MTTPTPTSSLEAKIVILGSQGVGKTTLVHRYIHSSPLPTSPPSTIGASFLTKRILDTDTNTIVRLQLWDTAGQERFRSISRLYYRGANACILCYSITDEASFREMGRWLTELRKECGEGVVLHVVGTKADLVQSDPARREVPFERCIAYVAENLFPAQSSTPPSTAMSSPRRGDGTAAASTTGEASRSGSGSGSGYNYRQFLASAGAGKGGAAGGEPTTTGGGGGGGGVSLLEGARSPSSKRSSGFWGQDVGWDCCHEISASSGEGVEEVFRVVTRKLVEQARKAAAAEGLLTAGGMMTPGGVSAHGGGGDEGDGYTGYFDGMHGRNVRGSFRVGRDRRSWLGFPSVSVGVGVGIGGEEGEGVDGNGGGGGGGGDGGAARFRRRCC